MAPKTAGKDGAGMTRRGFLKAAGGAVAGAVLAEAKAAGH
jgi:hypothetical protein